MAYEWMPGTCYMAYDDVTGARASVMKLNLDLSCLPPAMTQDLATVTRATGWGKEEEGRGVCLEGRWLGAGSRMDYWKWPRSSPFGVTRALYKPSVLCSCWRTRTLSLWLHRGVELAEMRGLSDRPRQVAEGARWVAVILTERKEK